MKPIEFTEGNVTFAKDQKPYIPLPGYLDPGPQGEFVACWKMTWTERLRVLFYGEMWVTLLTLQRGLTPSRLSPYKSQHLNVPITRWEKILNILKLK